MFLKYYFVLFLANQLFNQEFFFEMIENKKIRANKIFTDVKSTYMFTFNK